MLEQEVQREYISQISNRSEIPHPEDNPVRIYRELVHYRFYEVIYNAMPKFCDHLGDQRLDALIFDFIRSKPASPYIWKAPGEFREFLIHSAKVDDIPFAADLMWFESVEVDLLMGQYEKPAEVFFDWSKPFKPSDSMRMKELHFAVNRDEYDYRETHPLLMYYQFDEHSVYFQEITPFMMEYLTYLRDMLPLEALEEICRVYGLEERDEVQALLQGALEEFTAQKIIKPK